MIFAPSDIPERFWTVEYNAGRVPSDNAPLDLRQGANCQLFAYALLNHFGKAHLSFRSSELWNDTTCTEVVGPRFEALDLLLFNTTPDAWGAHVAVSLGEDRAIHLSKRVGRPAVWSLDHFRKQAEYRTLVGAKRVLRDQAF